MDETITRSAGARHGQEMTPAQMEQIIRSIGRTPRQRDTLQTTVTLDAVNSVDNADIYKEPFDPGETRNGSESFQRREQSIALEFAWIQRTTICRLRMWSSSS